MEVQGEAGPRDNSPQRSNSNRLASDFLAPAPSLFQSPATLLAFQFSQTYILYDDVSLYI